MMDDNDTDFEWGNDDDTSDSVEETDFRFDFEQQAQNELGADEDDIFIDGLMGGGIGPWKVSLSAQALDDLKQSRSEGNHLHIFKKLQSLASGDWVRRSVARPVTSNGHDFQVRLFQALYGGNGRILWQVDVGYDEKRGSDSQIVRVWRIGDVKEIQASLGAVERAQKRFSAEHIKCCKTNILDKASGLKLPALVDLSSEKKKKENGGLETESDSGDPPGRERVHQDMLISGRFHTLTVNVFTSILHGQDHSSFPFDVTGPEATIIKHKNAAFILGRSGTGKTSCLLYKLMCRYLARNMELQQEPIRQLLLTRSEPLAQVLQRDVKLLIDTQLLRLAGLPNVYEDGNNTPSQTERMDMGAETTEDLSSLRTDDFPFVCTFDHFLRRLENTIAAKYPTIISSRQLIDYTIFREAYWPRFPARSKGRLQPDMVFTEIMGVLKGGSAPLSRQQYISTSARIAPTFTTEEDRQAVYTLFECYKKRKMTQDEQDGIDRVRSVMRVFECNEECKECNCNEKYEELRKTLKGMFEEIYVDEVQDQRPLEISLLLNLVQNPRGVQFAGDSAQCISQDSTFRFPNLKALFYNHYSSHPMTAIDPSAAKPTLFTLSHNFRSHQRILRLASWVMEKMWRGFPDCVDKLPPEIGTYMGPTPVIIIGPSLVSFLKGAAGPTTAGQIVTQQIIIVRDRAVQRELEPQLPRGSVIFTILQSKGMEYDDVFLYEFFSRSPSLGGFRSMMEGGSWEGYASMHPSMCNELKNLYVAITRPRSRLFILESDPGCIPELLKGLVVVKRFNNEDLRNLSHEVRQGSTSSSDPSPDKTKTTSQGGGGIFDTVRPTNTTTVKQWIETGSQCMDRGVFDQALRCFENAGDSAKIKLASASLSEQRGKECSARRDKPGALMHFKVASEGFLRLGMNERAAACLEARGDFVKGAELYKGAGRYEKAARLFKRAGEHDRAADEYFNCGKPSMALSVLYEAKEYRRLISDFHTHRDKIPDNERLTYAKECNRHVRRKGRLIPDLQSKALAMFTSDGEKEEFLREFKCSKELVEFYVCRGRIKEALLLAATSDDFDDALEGMIERGEDYNELVVGKGVEREDMRLEDVFNYAQTKRLLSSLSKGSKGLSLNYKGRHAGIEWGRKWERFVAVAREYILSGEELDRRSIKEEWIKDYLDTIVSVNIKYFLGVTKDLAAIPLTYLYGLGQKINEMSTSSKDDEVSQSTRDSVVPQSVLLALGVLHISGEAKPYKVLKWSRLHSQVGGSDFEYKVMAKKIVDYLTKQLDMARPLVEKKMQELWEGFSVIDTKCAACTTRVAWGEPQVEGLSTKCTHTFLMKARFEKLIQDLMRIHSSLATLGEEYTLLWGVKPPENLPQLNDYWLDAFLNRLAYHSACFESAECIVKLRNWLRTPETSSLFTALRGRFWGRWESWKLLGRKEDFTELLEAYQLGVNLGLGRDDLDYLINPRRIVVNPYHAGRWGRGGSRNQRRKEQPSQVDAIFEALRQCRTLHEWMDPLQYSMGRMLHLIDGLLLTLEDMLQSTNYLSFCRASVISVFECILTLLLFASQRTNIVIPASWTHLYLPLWARNLRDCTDNQMYCYKDALVRTMCLFYKWVIKSHERGKQDVLLQRRCLDLCFVALVNIGSVVGCQGLWEEAQKVLLPKETLKRMQALCIQPHQLIEQLSEAFKLYNGTDSLTLHVREGPLDKRALYLSSFATLQQLPRRAKFRPPPRKSHESTLYSTYLIISWYRRCRYIRAEYRRYMESATWQAVHRLYALCERRLPLAAVVMTDGLDLYVILQELSRRIDAADERERQRAEKEGLVQIAPPNRGVGVVMSGESEQKCADGLMAADQAAESAKTESEILHVQLQERYAFFDVGTAMDKDAERWRERCNEETAAAREMEKMLKDWEDKLDEKPKADGAKKPEQGPKTIEKNATSVPRTREGKGKAVGQLAPVKIQQNQAQEDINEEKKVEVSPVLSRRARRNAAKREKREMQVEE